MKRPIAGKTNTRLKSGKLSGNREELAKGHIDRALREIHKKMIDLFHVDFTFFSNIKIVGESEILDWLAKQVEISLQGENLAYERAEWRQSYRFLLGGQLNYYFKNLAYYDQEKDTFCISKNLLENFPQTVITTSVHELSEKMLSTLISPVLKKRSQALMKMFLQIEKINDIREMYELFNEYVELTYMSVFKEGCCEAISLHTLRHINPNRVNVDLLEEELQTKHSECIGLLLNLEKVRKCIENAATVSPSLDTMKPTADIMEAKKQVVKALRASPIIKVVSYYLGYPLARAFIERYSLEALKYVFEGCPPSKAEHFSHPQTYLQLLQSRELPQSPLGEPR